MNFDFKDSSSDEMDNASFPHGYAFEPIRTVHVDPGSDRDDRPSVNEDLSDDYESGPSQANRLSMLAWCRCEHCTVMQSNEECVCCCELPSIGHRIVGFNCITLNPLFSHICTDIDALDVAMLSVSHQHADPIVRPFA